jgi:hypothetical protein
MNKYKILFIVYLVSVVSSSVAKITGMDVQNFHRVPFIGIRWIDVAILIVMGGFLQSLTVSKPLVKNGALVAGLGFLYLSFEFFQLVYSWGVIDAQTQISLFFATLCVFILIDCAVFKLDKEEMMALIKEGAVWGSVVLIISNFYLFYSFLTGNVIYQDLDVRIAIDVAGTKETVTTAVLTPFVYGFSLYFSQTEVKPWQKIVFVTAIISVFLSLVTSFHRGTLFEIGVITIYVIVSSKQAQQAFGKLIGLAFLLGVFYLLFGGILRSKGYDPLEKIIETTKFAADINNPDWDKGRSGPQGYAIKAWQQYPWTGVGYDALYNYGLPDDYSTAHNGVITSLFHRGIIGTTILLTILLVLYSYVVKLWFYIRKEKGEMNEIMGMLCVVAFLWIMPFLTQEVTWEKYGLSIQYVYFGLIMNYYKQRHDDVADEA